MSHVASIYTTLRLWGLRKSQGYFWTTPWALWEVTDQGETPPAMENWLSTKNYTTGWVLIVGRHFFLQKTGLLQQRTDKTWQCIFNAIYVPPPSSACLRLRGAWFLTLGPSITLFDAWWPKVPSVQFDIKWNAHKHTMILTSIIIDQEARDANMHNAMQPRHASKLIQYEHVNKHANMQACNNILNSWQNAS